MFKGLLRGPRPHWSMKASKGFAMLRIAPSLMAALLCGSMLAGCGTTDLAKLTGGQTEQGQAKKDAQTASSKMPADLDAGVRQAQLLRSGGQAADAAKGKVSLCFRKMR